MILVTCGSAIAQVRYDITFHNDGILTQNPFNITGRGLTSGIHVFPDGKMLIAGSANANPNNFLEVTAVLQKLNADGSLDVTFGNNGLFVYQYDVTSTTPQTFITSMDLQPDGKILLAGYSNSSSLFDTYRAILIRVNSNGTLDTNFANSGAYRSPNVADSNIEGRSIYYDVKVLDNGQIVAAGNVLYGNQSGENCHDPQSPWCAAISLFSADGLFQSRVNHKLSPESGMREYVNDIEVLPDGKLIGAVSSETSNAPFRIAKFQAGGARDTTWGVQGIVTIKALVTSPARMSYAVTVQNDGKILVSGREDNALITARVNANGTLDPTYGMNGVTPITAPESRSISGADVIVQSDGKIISAGSNKMVRFHPDGSRDLSFGPNGEVNIAPNQTPDIGSVYPIALAQDENGRIHFAARTTLTEPGAGPVDRWSAGRLTNGTIAWFDFDGDARTDVSIHRPSLGQWWYLWSSTNDPRGFSFGNGSDIPVPGDHTGDGKWDVAFFRPGTGEWYVLRSEDFTFYSFPWGQNGDIPVSADFDGDGTFDQAVYRPSQGMWFINKSGGGVDFIPFGIAEDKPVVEDYDGDGKDDIAIFRPSVSEWWILRSLDGIIAYQFGAAGDMAVPGDYTADGKADVALFRPSTGEWFVLRSDDFSFFAFPFGQNGDIPAPGDYDGDGEVDPAVFRPSDSTWYKLQSKSGFQAVQFGAAGDVPLPSIYATQ